ncbi:MAG: pyruvate kinase alpha/beta domain-containing protein [Chloroflexota bacterium]|nr:pyruvate kinase alpha/beta domain-containing protein [Chloroflexota bacterium]
MDIEATTYYFESPGNYTDKVLEVAKARALERGIKQIVISSTSGKTGLKAAEAFGDTGIEVVVVTHQTGHAAPGVQLLTEENRKRLNDLGIMVVTGTDAFEGGVGLGITRRRIPETEAARPSPETISMMSRMYPAVPPVARTVASVLRLFCQGVKVAVEVTLMAADAGAIPVGRDVIAIGGTGGDGVDTALLLGPANTTNFLDLDIHEIIAKPFTKA